MLIVSIKLCSTHYSKTPLLPPLTKKYLAEIYIHVNTTRSNGSARRDKHLAADLQELDTKQMDLPTGEEILAEEMKLAAIDKTTFDYPEIPQYSDEELKRSLASNLENKFDTQENEEVQLMALASQAFELWSNSKGKYTLLGAILKVSESTNRNSLFDNDNVVPKTSVNEQISLAVIEYLL